jgi:WD40 repeat protein
VASNEAIRAIKVLGDEVFVTGCDPVIRAWHPQTKTSRSFLGHRDWVVNLYFHNGYLYSVSYDKTIRVWSLETNKCLEEFIGHEDGVTCLEFANGMMYSGSHDHSIRSWDIEEMYLRIQEKALMTQEDILSLKIETYFRVLAKRRGKKGKKRGKGKGKKGKKGRR